MKVTLKIFENAMYFRNIFKKIKSNWKKINIYSNFKASAVVKANAYGFGLEEISLALSQSGCNFFYVAQIEEGIKLRQMFKI